MTFLFVAFTSRSAASLMYQKLYLNGVVCSLISTPSAANVGCGLSIKFREDDYSLVKSTVSQANYYLGFFRATQINSKLIVTRL